MFSDFTWKKILLQEMELSPFLYGPDVDSLN